MIGEIEQILTTNKMKNLKTTILSAFIALCCLTSVNAQNRISATPTVGKSLISFGGGLSSPSTDAKDKAFLSNSIAINADFYLPLFKKGWDGGGARDHIKGHKIDFGLNFGGAYNFGGSGGFGTTPNPFAVTGQTSSMVVDKGTDPRNPGFRMGAGPQANFYFGKFIVSPMVLGEYFSMTQNERSSVQTTQFNGQSYEFTLASMPKTKTSGFAVTPKLRLYYMFNHRFGLFADASYTMGPKIETTVSKLVPLGAPDPNGNYELQALQFGSTIKGETQKTSFKALGLNVGIVIGLGKTPQKNILPQKEKSQKTFDKISEEKFPLEIQNILDEQDKSKNKSFEYQSNNQKVQSLCNFKIEEVEIKCDGKDQQGNKKYRVTIAYKNLSTTGIGSLGHYLSACNPTLSNGSFVEAMPSSSATISSLTPSTTVKTIVSSPGTQLISFDFVPSSSFTSLHLKGNLIDSPNCGNCDDIISIQLPNCCDACELNPVNAYNNSISIINANEGSIKVVNTVSSPNSIVKIQADLVSVKISPLNSSCNKCNNQVKQQDNFIGANNMVNITNWANSGQSLPKPDYPLGGSRALEFNSETATGVNIASGAQISHTIGIAPASCCGDIVEIWIRYTIWDADCKVCDKLVKSTITRIGACDDTNPNSGSHSHNQIKK